MFRIMSTNKSFKILNYDNFQLFKRRFSANSKINYSSLWNRKRFVAIALSSSIPMAFLFQDRQTDSLMASLICWHMYQ
jgi:hypothetical protein